MSGLAVRLPRGLHVRQRPPHVSRRAAGGTGERRVLIAHHVYHNIVCNIV